MSSTATTPSTTTRMANTNESSTINPSASNASSAPLDFLQFNSSDLLSITKTHSAKLVNQQEIRSLDPQFAAAHETFQHSIQTGVTSDPNEGTTSKNGDISIKADPSECGDASASRKRKATDGEAMRFESTGNADTFRAFYGGEKADNANKSDASVSSSVDAPSSSAPPAKRVSDLHVQQDYSIRPFYQLPVKVQRQFTLTRSQAKKLSTQLREELVPLNIRLMGQPKVDCVYFVAKDLCQLAHLRKGSVAKALSDYKPDEQARMPVLVQRSTGGCTQILTVLTVTGVKRLMNYSRSQSAKVALADLLERIDEIIKNPDLIKHYDPNGPLHPELLMSEPYQRVAELHHSLNQGGVNMLAPDNGRYGFNEYGQPAFNPSAFNPHAHYNPGAANAGHPGLNGHPEYFYPQPTDYQPHKQLQLLQQQQQAQAQAQVQSQPQYNGNLFQQTGAYNGQAVQTPQTNKYSIFGNGQQPVAPQPSSVQGLVNNPYLMNALSSPAASNILSQYVQILLQQKQQGQPQPQQPQQQAAAASIYGGQQQQGGYGQIDNNGTDQSAILRQLLMKMTQNQS